jgi:hypothetical protein
MVEQTAKRQQLRDIIPFTFKDEVTKLIDDFTFGSEEFLVRRNLFGVGLWKRSWGCFGFDHIPYGMLADFTRLPTQEDWSMPIEQCPKWEPLPAEISGTVAARPQNWTEYYNLRDVSLDSPLAMILTFPMTVYRVLTILSQRESHSNILEPGSSICIHLIGAAKELDQAPMFGDLPFLFPGVKIIFCFIGGEIGQGAVREAEPNLLGHESLSYWAFSGDYLEFVDQTKGRAPEPTVAIGLNAGLGAYPEWVPTLRHLVMNGTPAFFTDYCEASCQVGEDILRDQLDTELSTPIRCVHSMFIRCCTATLNVCAPALMYSLNPFFCPMSRQQRGMSSTYPEYSNAFVFGIN